MEFELELAVLRREYENVQLRRETRELPLEFRFLLRADVERHRVDPVGQRFLEQRRIKRFRMPLRLRYELYLERLLLRREHPKRRLRLIRPGERRRLHRGDLFPNVERLRVGSDEIMDERRRLMRVRVQFLIRLERQFLRFRRSAELHGLLRVVLVQ